MTNSNRYSAECFNCGDKVSFLRDADEIQPADCRLSLNLPGFICPDCVDDALDTIPDPPGLVCIHNLSEPDAVEVLLHNGFCRDVCDAVEFFSSLFPTSSRVTQASAIRLHMEGFKRAAYNVLESGLGVCDEPDRLRVEMAAMAGMDEAAALGLTFLQGVSETTERYHVVKGNLLRKMDEWNQAADCWRHGIEADRSYPISWFNLGYYYSSVRKDYKSAETHYRQACDAFPTNRKFWAYLGDSRFFQGDKKSARLCYEKALSLEDSDQSFEKSLRAMLKKC